MEKFFIRVKDPRVLGKVRHKLEDVLRIALIGVLCACDDYNEISDFIEKREEAPISRGCNGLYILNTMVSEHEICISEKRIDDKTNELTVLPALIASMCIVGALVSVDAMGTHRNIARQILMQDGNYLMALKDNQPILKELVESMFRSSTPLSTHRTEEKGHGREEKRDCAVLDTKLLKEEGLYEEWPGLQRIIRMERERLCDGVRTKETVYYLSSEQSDDASYFRNASATTGASRTGCTGIWK